MADRFDRTDTEYAIRRRGEVPSAEALGSSYPAPMRRRLQLDINPVTPMPGERVEVFANLEGYDTLGVHYYDFDAKNKVIREWRVEPTKPKHDPMPPLFDVSIVRGNPMAGAAFTMNGTRVGTVASGGTNDKIRIEPRHKSYVILAVYVEGNAP